MPTVADLREGLAANLRTIKGVQASAYMLASPTPPSMHVFPADATYDVANARGIDLHRFTVQAFVGNVSDIGAQQKLDELANPYGATSVKQAVESDRTLGGAAQDVRVTGFGGYRQINLEGRGPMLMCEWTVEVYARGTT
jgi:hypothetical protein